MLAAGGTGRLPPEAFPLGTEAGGEAVSGGAAAVGGVEWGETWAIGLSGGALEALFVTVGVAVFAASAGTGALGLADAEAALGLALAGGASGLNGKLGGAAGFATGGVAGLGAAGAELTTCSVFLKWAMMRLVSAFVWS